ncbi:hypothetical protein MD484_g26, partial [Candolleomyces efflorescens]
MLKTIFRPRRPHLKLLLSSSGCTVAVQRTPTPREGRRLTYATNALAFAPPPPLAHSPPPSLPQPESLPLQFPPSALRHLEYLLKSFRETGQKSHALRAYEASDNLAPLLSDTDYSHSATEQILSSDNPQIAVDHLRLSYELGVPLKFPTFDCVCQKFASIGRWDLVLATVQEATDQDIPMNKFMLNWIARAYLETRDYAQLQAILQEFSDHGVQPNQWTFHLMLSGAIRNRDLVRAQQVIQEMERHGIPIDAKTHARIAQAYKNIGVDDIVEERAVAALPELSPSLQVHVLNCLMRGHMDNNHIDRAVRLLSLFEPKSVEIIIEVMFGAGGLHRTAETTTEPYPQPLPTPPLPNASTFAIFMHHCSHQRNLSRALQLLQCMISQGVAPTDHIVKTLVQTCFSCGRPSLAVQLVAGTCNSDEVKPRHFSRIHPGRWPREEFQVHVPGMSPSILVFNALLQGTLQRLGVDGAMHVIKLMRMNGIKPNERTLDLILCHLHFVDRANPRTLFRQLYTLTGPDLQPTEKHLRIIIRSIQRQEEYLLHRRGWDSLRYFVANRKVPERRKSGSPGPFNRLAGLTLPMFRDYQRLAEPFLQHLESRDIKPEPETIAVRIRHEAVIKMDVEAAAEIFQVMLARGITPNAYHYAALMEGYALRGDTNGAEKVFQTAISERIVPNVALYTILITAHCRHGQPYKALQVFRKMVGQGIQPDVPSIDAVASAFYAVGDNAMAKKVLISLWPYVQPFPSRLRSLPVLKLACHFRSQHHRPRNTAVRISLEERYKLHMKLARLMKEWRRQAARTSKSVRWSEVREELANDYTS